MKKFLKLLGNDAGEAGTPASSFYTELSVDVLARTIWGEARGEGLFGMEAVANVVMNRVAVAEHRGHYWWGTNVISVCQKPYQFSCWNRSDANYRKLQEVSEDNIHYATAVKIARRAIAGVLPERTNGATHYHAKGIAPNWSRGIEPSSIIGNHIFYQLIEG